jgi:hypothetical protein
MRMPSGKDRVPCSNRLLEVTRCLQFRKIQFQDDRQGSHLSSLWKLANCLCFGSVTTGQSELANLKTGEHQTEKEFLRDVRSGLVFGSILLDTRDIRLLWGWESKTHVAGYRRLDATRLEE